jgi:hypothetical protein
MAVVDPKDRKDIELLRIVSMPEAARLSGLDEDELRELYPNWIIQLTDTKQGMRVMHALRLVPVSRAAEAVAD